MEFEKEENVNVAIITINLESEFSTMSELVSFVAKKLRNELKKLPHYPKINAFQEVQLIKATRQFVSYKVRFGQVNVSTEEGGVDGDNE